MNDLKIESVKVKDLKPYKNNPRINDEAVAYVKRSIQEFGFKVPLVIDKHNVVVTGHTRLKAAKELGLDTVPCIRADDLNDEQIKAFRIADNKVGEIATWDFEKLDLELADIDIDMSAFGIDMGEFEGSQMSFEDDDFDTDDESGIDWAEQAQNRVENILQLGKGQFKGEGKYDIPILKPVKELPPIKEWLGFKYMLQDDDPTGKAIHFFIDDYQFERIWKYPERYLDRLKQYVCVATPDFSPYGDMPLACQLFNHYRKHWVGAWLQAHGVTVIPTIRCSTDDRSLEWYLDGEPKGGIVIMSSMWAKVNSEQAKVEYRTMKERLKPVKVFIYGTDGSGMGIEEGDNVEYMPTMTQAIWHSKKE